MSIIEKYNIKFTMGRLLEIERETGINIISQDFKSDLNNALINRRRFLNVEIIPFKNALIEAGKIKTKKNEDDDYSKLTPKEKSKLDELLTRLNQLDNKIKELDNQYYFSIAQAFSGDEILDDDEITIDDLNKFKEDYDKAIKRTLIPKLIDEKKEDTGK